MVSAPHTEWHQDPLLTQAFLEHIYSSYTSVEEMQWVVCYTVAQISP